MTATAITQGVRVTVESRWLPERSDPERHAWLFTYEISIENVGEDIVQLLSRHWIIENAHGKTEEVRGPGVVGETPVLAPGQGFSYRSFCPLNTEIGSMRGTFQMRTVSGDGEAKFDIEVPHFALFVPSALN